MRRLGTLPLQYQPGERWLYSTGSHVLGVLIARVAGQPLEEFLRERIFEPLGMRDTGFTAVDPGRLTTAYIGRRDHLDPADPAGALDLAGRTVRRGRRTRLVTASGPAW
jgi:CubicO group peptidase (beta-lactamase class C family)